MKKYKGEKGFTLIELLAIIVILAIIAVITVPIILNIIDNAKRGAAVSSAYGYTDSITKYYLNKLSVNGKSYSYDLLLTSAPYQEIGFNFTETNPSVSEYIWYFDNGNLKFKKN